MSIRCCCAQIAFRSALRSIDHLPHLCPAGKVMLLPEDEPKATHIMIATGTGIAPFRGYLRRMFMESGSAYHFNGLAWLFLGVANSDSLLYDEEFSSYLCDYPGNFRYDKALSREQKNRNGGKMYVQDKIEEYNNKVFKLLDEGAHIYFCGLKGMMPGIQETLKRVAEQRGEKWGREAVAAQEEQAMACGGLLERYCW